MIYLINQDKSFFLTKKLTNNNKDTPNIHTHTKKKKIKNLTSRKLVGHEIKRAQVVIGGGGVGGGGDGVDHNRGGGLIGSPWGERREPSTCNSKHLLVFGECDLGVWRVKERIITNPNRVVWGFRELPAVNMDEVTSGKCVNFYFFLLRFFIPFYLQYQLSIYHWFISILFHLNNNSYF